MADHWTCTAQRYMVRYFPRASQRIKLPRWMWCRLCASDCSAECLATCPGCAQLGAELQPRGRTTRDPESVSAAVPMCDTSQARCSCEHCADIT